MSMRARASGAVGTIVDGRIRDLQEHRDLCYPVSLGFLTHILFALSIPGVCSRDRHHRSS
jgi:hypothetical protein